MQSTKIALMMLHITIGFSPCNTQNWLEKKVYLVVSNYGFKNNVF